MSMKRTLCALIAAICLATAAAPVTWAASEPQILQWRLDADGGALTLYVRHPDGAAPDGVKIGGIEIEDAQIAPDAGETALSTWILFDDSDSMPEETQAKASGLLSALLDGRSRTETCLFRTFSDIIGGAAGNDESGFVAALNGVLREESGRTGTEFSRIVLISSGGGALPDEKDMDALRELLLSGGAVSGFPVYVIGCRNGANDEILSQMYALSAETGARCWNADEIAASDIANIMRWEEIPLKVSLTLPESLRTGAEQEIEVTFPDGSSAHSVIAPSAADNGDNDENAGNGAVADNGESDSATESGDNGDSVGNGVAADGGESADSDSVTNGGESGGEPFPIAAVALVLLLCGAGAAAFLTARRGSVEAIADMGRRVFGGKPSGAPIRGETLNLTDISRPEQRFSASLRGRVTVGRSPDNLIALTYDPTVSRRHCEIYLRDSRLWIQDCNSSGGTYVGKRRVRDVAELSDGAVVRLGYASYEVAVTQ